MNDEEKVERTEDVKGAKERRREPKTRQFEEEVSCPF